MHLAKMVPIVVLVLSVSALAAAFTPVAVDAPAAVDPLDAKKILIYEPSLSQLVPLWPENEATIASALGHSVTVMDPLTWMGLGPAEFGMFDAIVFGDPKCGPAETTLLDPANANKANWSSVITGPTIVIGTTPQFYQSAPNVQNDDLIANGIGFAASGPGTGLYVSLSCYYVQAPSDTPVEFLSAVGDFQLGGRDSCSGNETIVTPDHPAMAGLTSLGQPAAGSPVGCATQEFLSAFPDSLIPLATGVRLSNEAVVLPFIVATAHEAPANPPADPPSDPPQDPGSHYTLFDAFWAEFDREDDEFEVEGTFTLGTASNGIDPLSDDVTVKIGAFEITIPVGSFGEDDDGEFEFEGNIDGMEVEMEIELEDDGTFEFEIEVEGADLPELEEAPEVTLIIGDDKGTTTANAEHEDEEDDENGSHEEDGHEEDDDEDDEEDDEHGGDDGEDDDDEEDDD